MKESNTLAGNATINQQQKEILVNTKGQYMKESNTLAGNATIKQQKRAQHKRAVHEGVRFPCRYCDQQYTSRAKIVQLDKIFCIILIL